jgi:hypothetical protein
MDRTAQNRERRRFEQWNIAVVVDWLNGKIPVEFSDRDETILIELGADQLRRIRRVFDLVLAVMEFPRARPKTWDMASVDELNGILRRYPKIFQFEMDSLGFCQPRRVPNSERIDAYEAGVVESMFDLGREGLQKLHTCACGKWYLKKSSVHTSCTPGCRKKKCETTPAYKKKRAARVKRTRKIHDEGHGFAQTKRSRPRPLGAIGKVSK